MLPTNLPVSIEGMILKDVHIVIEYSLEIKVIELERETSYRSMKTYVVPF